MSMRLIVLVDKMMEISIIGLQFSCVGRFDKQKIAPTYTKLLSDV